MKQKPIILELEEAKISFVQLINTLHENGLPLYLIDMALSGVYTQLKEGAKSEIAMAQQQMNESQDELTEQTTQND